MDDINKIIKHLNDVKQNAKEIEETKQVSLRELLSDEFLKANTKFSHFDEIAVLDEDVIYSDVFIQSNTNFQTYEEMTAAAVELWAIKKLDL